MKLIIGLLAAAGLSGCVGYGGGYYGSGYYGGTAAYSSGTYYEGGYASSAPVYIYGSGGYTRDYRHDRRGYRDRDGDGVPNWRDAYPNDGRRY